MHHDPPHLALFIPSLAGGGVARSMLNLAGAFVDRGLRVDLVLCQATGPYLNQIPAQVKVIELVASSEWLGRMRTLSADPTALQLLLPVLLSYKTLSTVRYLSSLVQYLQREQPSALLSAKPSSNLAALWARRLAGVRTRIVVSERTNLSHQIYGPKRRKWRWRFIVPVLHRSYPWADAIVAVSNGVADDLSRCAKIPRERITTIYNPITTPELFSKAQAPLNHSWFQPSAPPVVLGAGRLTAQKDFPTLLRAFARVRERREVRLIILGEAKNSERRTDLSTLATQLGVATDVELPGFVDNPFAYMARAAVFVLSSRWEGLPGVLIQALACGCPVVSTDCPSGPAEVLDHGKYGPLVPIGDDAALAAAILSNLDAPPDPDRLRAHALMFSVDHTIAQYLEVLLGNP